jgi:hypothetical protein
LDKIQSLYDAKAIQRNPFNATIDISLALQSVDMACYNNLFSHDVDRPKKFLSCAEELSTKVKNMITFYEEKNVGARDLLIERLVQEIAIVRELIENDAVLLSHGPSASLEAFTAAVKGFLFIEKGYLSQPIGTTQTIIDDGEYFTGTLYDLSSFLSESLFNFIVCDVFIEDNSCYVKEFMHSNGFKDVTIERTTSPHNGRTNVWIIKGIKS